MTYDQFEIGRAYYATPALPGARQRIVIPIGREGSDIQFAFVDALANTTSESVSSVCREFVRLDIGDGHIYSCSCACSVPASESAKVLDLIRSCHA